MKKTKLISLALAALMVIGLIPFTVFSAAAADIPAMPTAFPDGTAVRSNVFRTGSYTAAGNDSFSWVGAQTNRNPRGANGFMFYASAESVDALAQFQLGIVNSMKRTGYGNGQARFETTVNTFNGGKVSPSADASITYYTSTDGVNWTEQTQSAGGSYYIGTTGSAWYYIPFSAFIYNGTDAHAKGNDTAWGKSFAYFMENYYGNNSAAGVISNMRIKAKGSAVTFGDIYMVYPELAPASDNAATTTFLPGIRVNSTEVKNTAYSDWTATASNGVVTISGATGNNTTNASNNRAWIGSSQVGTTDVSGASGIRFYVDSSSLKADNTQLLLRIRLKDGINPSSKFDANNKFLLTDQANGYVANGGTSNPQFMLQSANSVVYIYDENGNATPCYSATNDADNSEFNDVVAIPSGYVGYVYIPMDSFYVTLLGSTGLKPIVSFDTAVGYGYGQKIDQIAIVQTYSNDANAANYSVSYSDFELVYEDVEVTQTSVSLGNDLALNVKAETKNGATVESATYTLGGATYTAKVKAIDGGYAVACDGILPQNVADIVKVTINAKVGTTAVSTTVETSVKDYCLKLLATDSASAEAKNAAADLLRYAGAAEVFANNTASTILDGATVTAISAFGAKTDFAALNLTDTSTKTESTVAGYDMAGAAIRLENALALKLYVIAPAGSDAAVKASFKLGNAEAVVVDVVDGVAVFSIGACDLDADMVITLTVDGVEAQTVNYSVTDYFASAIYNGELAPTEADLVRALYDYGVSASAYADSLK